MSTLATHFRAILAGLQVVIGIVAANDRPRLAFLACIHNHLNRTIQRFEKLVANWRAGTLPKTGKPRPGRPARPQTTPRLPSGFAWILRNVDHHEARCQASRFQVFLATPECAHFLAEVPRAGRILRPVTRSLGLQMPGDPPRPDPKPPKPKPSVTPKPGPMPWLARLPAPQPQPRVQRRPIFLKIP